MRYEVVVVAILCPTVPPLSAQVRDPVTSAQIDVWMSELSNAGRWGPADERGTLNLITPGHTVTAAGLVREGYAVSLSHDYLKEAAEDATSPFGHEILGAGGQGAFVSDRFNVVFHGYAHSHLDALCHMSHQGISYNGFARSAISADEGCPTLAITTMKSGIATRGILVDIPRLRGLDYLEPGAPIYPEDLEAWEAETGVRIGPGDALLVRSGRWARRAEEGPWATGRLAAGLHASVAPWLHARGVSILGSDYTNDVLPSGVDGVAMPIHQLTLVAMGMPLFDNLDLEAVAQAAAERERWEFFLVAAPLAVPGGTGSPLNPLAIF
jgi:kynurenine formamidase